MMHFKGIKISGMIVGTLFAGMLLTAPAHAESIDSVMVRVNSAHGSGAISNDQYINLMATLDAAKAATNDSEYNSAVEAYSLLATGNLVAHFDPFRS